MRCAEIVDAAEYSGFDTSKIGFGVRHGQDVVFLPKNEPAIVLFKEFIEGTWLKEEGHSYVLLLDTAEWREYTPRWPQSLFALPPC